MKSLIVVLAVLVACVSVAASPLGDTDEAELRRRIDEANAAIDEASVANDYETIASFYAEDVVILPNHEPMIVGREGFIENERASREAGFKILAIDSETTRVFRAGNLIHEIGSYEVQLEVPGAPYPITDSGKHLVIWEVQPDESLKVKLEMWNNDEFPEY